MHVLMLSLDTSILTQHIGNSRPRHEFYAEQAGRVSLVVCNRRSKGRLEAYRSTRLTAHPTNSLTHAHYLWDGYRQALHIAAQHAEADAPIDLITAQEPFLTALIGLLLRPRLNAPLIIQDHSSFLESEHFAAEQWRNRALRWLAMQTLPRADAVRVVNWQERAGVVRLGLPANRVCTIPLVPALKPFMEDHREAALRWRASVGLSAEAPLVLWVGRPVAFKNLPMLVRAFARVLAHIPDARLVLVGAMHGTEVAAHLHAAQINQAVVLTGAVPHHDLPAIYQAATIYALASNYEGLPGVLLEASAAALPIVSTANNGAKDLLVHGQTGLLTPVGDEAALADAILDLLRDPARRAAIGAAARAYVLENFDEVRLMRQWVHMWEAVVAGRSACDS
jgi:glycosyltransferase involved in cell wall biosynthesis